MEYRIDLAGNVPEQAAAGTAALREEAAAGKAASAELLAFRDAASAIGASTKAVHDLAAALRETKAASSAPFSESTATDFKPSKFEQGAAPNKASEQASAAAQAAKVTTSGATGAGKASAAALGGLPGLIGKATAGLLAYGAALAGVHGLSDLTRMAIGWRTLGQLQMLSWKATWDLRRAVMGVDAQPLVRTFQRLERNLSQSTVTGKALSGILTRGFNAAFGAVESLGPVIENVFQHAVLYALQAEGAWLDLRIATKPLIEAVSELGGTVTELLSSMGILDEDGSGAMKAIAQGASAAASAVDSLNNLIKDTQHSGRVEEPDTSFYLSDLFTKRSEEGKSGGTTTGKAIGDGIVEGMKATASAVDAGGEALGKAAVVGARRGADAHSPSEATKRLGRDLGAGEEIGLQQSRPGVEAEAERSLGRAGVPAAEGSSGTPGARGISITVGQIGPFALEPRSGSPEDLRASVLALAPSIAQELFRAVLLRAGVPVPGT